MKEFKTVILLIHILIVLSQQKTDNQQFENDFNCTLISDIVIPSDKILDLSNKSLCNFNLPNNSKNIIEKLNLSCNNIENVSFNNFDLIKQLNLSFNRINIIENFTSTFLELIDLSNNNINEFNFSNSTNLTNLNLSNNVIRLLDNEQFKGVPNLTIINLSHNQLQNITDGTFKAVSNLIRLDLSNNVLDNLSPKCFIGLNRLRYINLSINKLVRVSSNVLQYLPNLSELILFNNKGISNKQNGLGFLLATAKLITVDLSNTSSKLIPFSLTRSIRYLRLRKNFITSIQSGDFDNYPFLEELDLSHNNISYVEDDALGRLENLKDLLLTNNSLKTIPKILPQALRKLYINYNYIKNLSKADFQGYNDLRYLDLSSNKIKDIEKHTFSNLKLRYLNLSNNDILFLPHKIFFEQTVLIKLDLSNLPMATVRTVRRDSHNLFPLPDYCPLEELYLRNSTKLTNLFFNDTVLLETLTKLYLVDISDTTIQKIPPNIRFLKKLSILIITGTKLRRINKPETAELKMYEFSENSNNESNSYFYSGVNCSHPGMILLFLLPVGFILAGIGFNRWNNRRKDYKLTEINEIDKTENPLIAAPDYTLDLW